MTSGQTHPIPASSVGRDSSPRRVDGLDSIRFLCALVVVMFHLGVFSHIENGPGLPIVERVGISICNAFFNGPAAVIVFFLVSGFCIHFPYTRPRKLQLTSFYTRRFVRIVLPAAVFFIILRYALGDKSSPQDSVLWSIICETIYYLVYPALLSLRRRSNWAVLIAVSVASAIFLILSHASQMGADTHGEMGGDAYAYAVLRWSTWIVGLPCWLLGCWLAENYHRFSVPSVARMWSVRIGIYGLSIALGMIHFHVHSVLTSNCILLDLFAVPALFWLGLETAFASEHPRIRLVEWAGGWSYSLYLVHPLVGSLLAMMGLASIQNKGPAHLLILPATLLASYFFFLLVERPSHLLAVAAGRAAEARQSKRRVSRVQIAE